MSASRSAFVKTVHPGSALTPSIWTQVLAVDVGGTHTRFAIASLWSDGTITLDAPITVRTSDYPDLATALENVQSRLGGNLPTDTALAVAGPIEGSRARMTNNIWCIDTDGLKEQLGFDRISLVNDFAAVGHAVQRLGQDQFVHLCGPEWPLPAKGIISIIGPGTGLGLALVWRNGLTGYHVQPTEGGHVGFAPVDDIDDAVLDRLRKLHGRVSVERVVSGPGIVEIYHALAPGAGGAAMELDDRTIWAEGLSVPESLAAKAVERFCRNLGSAAGDFALASGASAVVIAGGLGLRIRNTLLASGFQELFCAKGRYRGMMSRIPVKLVVHPQPGLLGAAAAFQQEFGQKEFGDS